MGKHGKVVRLEIHVYQRTVLGQTGTDTVK